MFELFETLKREKTIGFTCGTFDVLHPGHVMMFEESKSKCDYLIVGLLSDPTISRPGIKNKPVQTMWERYIQLQAISVIDYIIPWDTEDDLINMLEMIRPDIRFVGEEYREQEFTGKLLCKKLGIGLYYNRRSHKYSSTELRSRNGIELKSNELDVCSLCLGTGMDSEIAAMCTQCKGSGRKEVPLAYKVNGAL